MHRKYLFLEDTIYLNVKKLRQRDKLTLHVRASVILTSPSVLVLNSWRRLSIMELFYLVNFIFISVLNVLFFFPGICLNSLVMISFWRSAQLRKKLCYFMIMVLSYCDLLVIVTNHPLTAIIALFLLTGYFTVTPGWVSISVRIAALTSVFSTLALLVMNFDRYLAICHPIFHRTSVTKRRLLFLVVTLIVVEATFGVLSANELVIPFSVHVLIFCAYSIPLPLFINCKLFAVAWKSRRKSRTFLQMRKTSLNMLSSCLLAVACFVIMSIPTFA